MSFVADIFLIAGALAAGFYCLVLSRRLTALKDAEGGIGQAVVSLSTQVDEMVKTVNTARVSATSSSESLSALTERAESVAQRLELLVASMHDLPEPQAPQQKPDGPMFSSRLSRAVGE